MLDRVSPVRSRRSVEEAPEKLSFSQLSDKLTGVFAGKVPMEINPSLDRSGEMTFKCTYQNTRELRLRAEQKGAALEISLDLVPISTELPRKEGENGSARSYDLDELDRALAMTEYGGEKLSFWGTITTPVELDSLVDEISHIALPHSQPWRDVLVPVVREEIFAAFQSQKSNEPGINVEMLETALPFVVRFSINGRTVEVRMKGHATTEIPKDVRERFAAGKRVSAAVVHHGSTSELSFETGERAVSLYAEEGKEDVSHGKGTVLEVGIYQNGAKPSGQVHATPFFAFGVRAPKNQDVVELVMQHLRGIGGSVARKILSASLLSGRIQEWLKMRPDPKPMPSQARKEPKLDAIEFTSFIRDVRDVPSLVQFIKKVVDETSKDKI